MNPTEKINKITDSDSNQDRSEPEFASIDNSLVPS
jgi:hypothetical protein